jgi:hypothetical protein
MGLEKRRQNKIVGITRYSYVCCESEKGDSREIPVGSCTLDHLLRSGQFEPVTEKKFKRILSA